MKQKTFLNFREFLLESSNKYSLWRNTSEEFLIELLKKGKVSSHGKKFVSLSEDPNSGGQDDYGDVQIEFDGDLLIKQGAKSIYYDDPDFWDEFPLIAQHVTGFKNAKAYYNDKGYKNAEEANEDGELTWEQYCESFSDEAETVVPQIKLVPNLILSVHSKRTLKPETIDLLLKLEVPINETKEDSNEIGLFSKGGKPSVKGTGYADKKKAEDTVKILDDLEKKGENKRAMSIATTMMNRAKYSANQTEGMKQAIPIFKEWIEKK